MAATFKILADAAGAVDTLGQVSQKMGLVGKRVDEAADNSKGFAGAFKTVKNSLDMAEKGLKQAVASTGLLGKEQKQAAKEAGGLWGAIKDLNGAYNAWNVGGGKAIASLGKMKKNLKEAEKEIGKTEETQKGATKETERAAGGWTKLEKAIVVVNQALDLASKFVRGITWLWDKASGAVDTFIISQVTVADDLAKTSRALDVEANSLQGMRSAANLAGIENRKFDKSIAMLSKNLVYADDGLATYTRAFKRMGVETHDAEGELRRADEVILDIADAFESGLVPSSQHAAMSMMLMADRTGKLAGLLKEGSGALDGEIERLERVGALMSNEVLVASEEFIDSQQRVKEAGMGVRNVLVEGVVPGLTAFNNTIAQSAEDGGKFRQTLANILKQGNLSRHVVNALSTAVEFIGDTFRNTSSRILGGTDKVLGALAEVAATETIFGTVSKGTADAINKARASVREFADELDDTLIPGEESAAKFAKRFNENLTTQQKLMRQAAKGAGDLATEMGNVADETEDAMTALEEYWNAAQAMKELGDTFKVDWGDPWGTEGQEFDLSEPLWDANKMAEDHKKKVEELIDQYKTLGQEAGSALGGIVGNYIEADNKQEALKSGFKDLAITIVKKIGEMAATAIAERAAIASANVAAASAETGAQSAAAITGAIATQGGSVVAATAAIAAGVAIMAGVISAIGDAGLTPEMMKATGGGRRTVMIKNSEMVVDERGTQDISAMFRQFRESQSQLGARDRGGFAGGGSQSTTIRVPVSLDGVQIAEVVTEHQYNNSQLNQGRRVAFND